jgi:cytochrome c oxidase subunit IV
MNTLQINALLAGLFFGIWPLFMNRSGLSGNASAMAFSGLVAIFVAYFGIRDFSQSTDIKWVMVICAGLFGAVGVMCFNGMLAKATPQNVGTLFVLMIVIQTAVPALYQVIMNGGLSLNKIVGFVLAACAAVLLTKG